MKHRAALYFLICLVVTALGGTWVFYLLKDSDSLQVFPATINRDCAPWDGAAFRVAIPMEESVLDISIFQAPAIKHRAAFSLQEGTGSVVDAFLLLSDGSHQQLSGKVIFRRVEEGIPVEGEYHFGTASGEQFTGRFRAEWGDEIVYCG